MEKEYGKTLLKTALNLTNGNEKAARAKLEEIHTELGGGTIDNTMVRQIHARLIFNTGRGKPHCSAYLGHHEGEPRKDHTGGRRPRRSVTKGQRFRSMKGQKIN